MSKTPLTDEAEKLWGEMPATMRRLESELGDTRLQLENALRFMADLNGCEWITGDSSGAIDMRQRARDIHALLSNLVYRQYPRKAV